MFYDKYVNLCAKKKISPSAAAEEMGFERSNVTRWSKGAEPRRATLERVAAYFDVPVAVFQMKAAPHSEIFRRNVDDSLSNTDAADREAWAANNSVAYSKITKMLEESYPITLEEAFEVAEILREPIYDLIGEGNQEEDEQTKNAPINGGELSMKDQRLVSWFRSLPEEKQKAILISQDAPRGLL